jgi:hypothetical protein
MEIIGGGAISSPFPPASDGLGIYKQEKINLNKNHDPKQRNNFLN